MIGHGFMGAAHSVGWRQAPAVFDLPLDVEMAVLVGRNAQTVEQSARRWGWSETATDWREVVARGDIDVIDIVTPGDSHAEIAQAALDAGKHVLCEKPLANTVPEAEAMVGSAARAGTHAIAGFTYRRLPATTLIRDMIRNGRIGRVQQVRAAYRQDWLVDPDAPLVWRLQKEHAGSGALGDIGAHIIDMVHYVTGQTVDAVTGTLETIVKRRPLPADNKLAAEGREEWGDVTVDDAALFTGRLSGGALASFEATRFAAGRKNALTIEVSGTEGALAWDLERLNEVKFYDRTSDPASQGFTTILATEPDHPYVSAWWPPGHGLGYEHGFVHQAKDLVEAIFTGEPAHSTFVEGLQVQRVLAAVEQSAQHESAWTRVGAAPSQDGRKS
ncbi:Gfo/Idh/MocA family protein [Nesterenkonia sp. Act20]|uniref:Gfo/Idh/MocA family protein n=1 Tax=Nesterenkonia sp. Act20 TaxID=1483432 RepID=UPI001C488588|nr:Gfo/Idh/MocA family oxidoreductase [Nesterenkonia sp. Act20]